MKGLCMWVVCTITVIVLGSIDAGASRYVSLQMILRLHLPSNGAMHRDILQENLTALTMSWICGQDGFSNETTTPTYSQHNSRGPCLAELISRPESYWTFTEDPEGPSKPRGIENDLSRATDQNWPTMKIKANYSMQMPESCKDQQVTLWHSDVRHSTL